MRQQLIRIHAASATLALLLITTFFISTLLSELIGSYQTISQVKRAIYYGVWLVIPLMVTAGLSGNKLAPNAKGGIIGQKKSRMPFIAANGVLVLAPAAVYLESLASAGSFTTTFYIVQVIELIAGAINISLMSLNLKSGLALRKAKRK